MFNASGCDFAAEDSRWTWEEDKLFENCLVDFPDGFPNRWETIAARLRTKSAAEVERHYVVLLDDLNAIEAGLIQPPAYSDKDALRSMEPPKYPNSEKKQVGTRKAGRPWTEDEHR